MTTVREVTFQAEPFKPETAAHSQKLAIGQLLADSHAVTYPDDPPLLPEKEALWLTHVTPGEQVERFAVWEGEKALAYATLSYDTKQNLHAAHARITVHPQARRQGLGHLLARTLEEVAQRLNRRTITFGTTSLLPASDEFAKQLGAQPALPLRSSRLDLHHVDWELVQEWQKRPGNDPYRLHVWSTIPEEYLDRAADMMMVMNTAPKGELDMEDWVITPEMIRAWEKMGQESGEMALTLAAENRVTGELDGYSQTFWDPERAALVFQGATAVRPSARGLGLGKWLKAAMLERVREEFGGAHWVRTNNANVNEAMLGINVSLGFTPWAQFTEWQLKLPE